ncbi:MAG: anthranilate phosphoribosyltransferase [Phycisphaerales bacterium]
MNSAQETPSPDRPSPGAARAVAGPPEFARAARPGDLTPFLKALLSGRTLAFEEAQNAFESIMSGQAHHAEMGALLALLATRVPTVDELAGAATVMRAHVDRVETGIAPERILDTAGTGGTAKLFNVSTAAAIVAAAAGAKVAKHGNRSRTGRGSAEVLAQLGVQVDADRATQRRCIEEAGICFCFAVHHHPAARHAMPVRQALGFPTIFNLLGPLTNPAGARRQVMGVYAPHFVRPIAQTLARLGSVHAIVLHGMDGLDELSISAPTMVAMVRDGRVEEYTLTPEELGIDRAPHEALAARDLAGAAALVESLLAGRERGPARDMLLANAGAALTAAGVAGDLRAGIARAAEAIDAGEAARTLERLRRASAAR